MERIEEIVTGNYSFFILIVNIIQVLIAIHFGQKKSYCETKEEMTLIEVKHIVHEDFINYKLPSMFIAFPRCDFKCDREGFKAVCQNSSMATQPTHKIAIQSIIEQYKSNPITSAFVIGGLEPFMDYEQLVKLVSEIRKAKIKDPIVIYTGYYPYEIEDEINELKVYGNLIFKFGRYRPDGSQKYDAVLGVTLASSNQFAISSETGM